MKKLFVLFVVVSLSLVVSAQKKDKQNFNPQKFEVSVSTMFPMAYPSVTLTDKYGISIHNDSITCHLPYLGEAHVAPIDNDGLNFSQPIKNFTLLEGKKGKKIIKFKTAKNAMERFDFTVTIFPDGGAEVYLLPSNAQSISYNGEIIINEETCSIK